MNNAMTKSKKIRVMFCTLQWLTGGMERKMSNLLSALVEHYDIYLFTVGSPDSTIDIPQKVHLIKLLQDDYPANYAVMAAEEIKKHNIDVVVGVANLLSEQLDLYESCIDMGVKTIAANSEHYFYAYGDKNLLFVKQRQQEVFRSLDAVLWQTNFSAAAYSLSNDNGYVIPNPNTFSKQPQLADKNNDIILSVGRFNDYIKRVDRILECFAKVSNCQQNAKLWLVGPCPRDEKIAKLNNRSIDQMINEYGIDETKINFIGKVGNVKDYYAQASLLLLTSDNEGFPNVVNEAASYGLPIVCNAIPGIEDLVVNGLNGFVSPQDDIDGLADNITELLSDVELRNDMGKKAANHVRKYDIPIIVKKWRLVIDLVSSSSSKSEIQDGLSVIKHRIDDNSALCHDLTILMAKAIANIESGYAAISVQLRDSHRNEVQLNQLLESLSTQHNVLLKKHVEIVNSKSWKIIERLRYLKSRVGYR